MSILEVGTVKQTEDFGRVPANPGDLGWDGRWELVSIHHDKESGKQIATWILRGELERVK